MKKLTILLLALIPLTASAGVAFLKYERISGMNKICVYDHIGSEYAITIKAHEICPPTIQVPNK